MNREEAKRELRERLKDYVEGITKHSGGKNYICPLCGSGTGPNHSGAFSLYEDKEGVPRWKCFSCGESGDLFDLIGQIEHIEDFNDRVKRAGELYGISIEGGPASAREDFSDGIPEQNYNKNEQYEHMDMNRETRTTEEEQGSLLPYYQECAKRLKDTDYYIRRGISEELARRFMLGYDPNWKHPKRKHDPLTPRLIIPTGKNSYIARQTDGGGGEYQKMKVGKVRIFNARAFKEAAQPIFVVEGEIDALSIIEVGGEAVGLGSITSRNLLRRTVEKVRPVQPLILALDTDGPGREAENGIAADLDNLGISYYRANPAGNAKDANEALTNDRAAFEAAVRGIVQRVEEEEERREEERRKEYRGTSSAGYIQEFVNGISDSVNTEAIPTGFSKLDKELDGGLYEGLYTLGAVSSLGKTTLALQMADQIAQRGKDVLIISLEMARTELMAKSISRHTLIDVFQNGGDLRHAKTTRGITSGARYVKYCDTERELIKRSIEAYGSYADHIYIKEGLGNLGVTAVRAAAEEHKRIMGKAPVVLIDYLQILAPYDPRATDKVNLDRSVLELKRLSRDLKTPVIVISSFNRESYSASVSMKAFKESGAIEYGSDVLIGLQLEGVGNKEFDELKAKKRNPRAIELVILKSRNSAAGGRISFKYYPLFNYFLEA